MEDLTKIIKGSIIVFLGLIFGKISSYAFRLIVAKNGAQEYGIFSLGYTIFNVVAILSLFGTTAGVVRFISYYRGKEEPRKIKEIISTALRLVLPLSITLSIILFVSSKYIAISIFHAEKLAAALKIFALAVPFMALSQVLIMVPRAFQKIKYTVYVRDIYGGIISLTALVLLFYSPYRLFGPMIAIAISSIAMFGLSIYYMLKVFPIKDLKAKFNCRLISYSWPLLFVGFSWWLLQWTDTLMIGSILDVRWAGIYNIAGPTAFMVLVVPQSVIGIFFPVITQIYAQKKDFKRVYNTITRWIFFVNLPLAILMILFSKQIILILFGEEYIRAALPLSILALSYFAFSIFLTSRNLLIMVKKTKLVLFITSAAAILNIVLNYCLIPVFGINGGAIATSLSLLLAILMTYCCMRKVLKVQPFDLNYLKGILAGFISLGTAAIISSALLKQKTPIGYLSLMSSIFLISYFSILIFLRSFQREDEKITSVLVKKGWKESVEKGLK
ncbi:MAG: flippase [Nanoarchaeota archaeon]|nr:flippase [Nanoarchaeota archaeon]MBU1005773.1 flippase [Nanoarchaeota archaeon]MBU1946644.1 flippase [Nanoarchaeota archaeon]